MMMMIMIMIMIMVMIMIMIMIIKYLTRVNQSAEAVINKCLR